VVSVGNDVAVRKFIKQYFFIFYEITKYCENNKLNKLCFFRKNYTMYKCTTSC